jgi:hypothetical protein
MAAEPLNYRNAAAPDGPTERAPKPPRVAIPVEFDQVLTRTPDLAAAHAIEVQLAREGIGVFRSDDAGGDAEVPTVVLVVRAEDLDRANEVAAVIFARRQRVKSLRP